MTRNIKESILGRFGQYSHFEFILPYIAGIANIFLADYYYYYYYYYYYVAIVYI
jgi:hypothetical protein